MYKTTTIQHDAQPAKAYPKLTGKLRAEIVRRIVAIGAPLRIVLFGSRARGDNHPDSDLDLLVIEDSKLPRFKRSVPYYEALAGLFPSKDVVVWTPDEITEWSATPNHFITTAMREGQVLYER